MTRLIFIDTETTSLRPDRRAWEIGIIERRSDGDVEHHWFIDSEDLDLGNADLMSLQIGRFHERHPDINADASPRCWPEKQVLRQVEALTRGAHLVGAVVSFDAEVLAARLRAHGLCPSWHYHLVDVEALAAGVLATQAGWADLSGEPASAQALREMAQPPWDSGELSGELGIDPADFDRHTALGDARWARAIYDAVMRPAAATAGQLAAEA